MGSFVLRPQGQGVVQSVNSSLLTMLCGPHLCVWIAEGPGPRGYPGWRPYVKMLLCVFVDKSNLFLGFRTQYKDLVDF